MNRPIPFSATLIALAIASPPLLAADNTQLQQLQQELAAMRKDYEKQLNALEARLKQAEARLASQAAPAGQLPVAQAVPSSAPTVAVASSPPSAGTPPAAPAAGKGFNPDIALVLAGSYASFSKDPTQYRIPGFLTGGEIGPGVQGFSLGESELTMSATIDPWFYGSMSVALAADNSASVEEAFIQTTSLPGGLGLKAGRFLASVGYQNDKHAHTWDFINAPLAYQVFLGGALAQDGLQLKAVLPTSQFVELGGGIGAAGEYPSGTGNRKKPGTGTLFAHTGGDVGASNSWRAGASMVWAKAYDRPFEDIDSAGNPVSNVFTGNTRLGILDAVWKWSPNGNSTRHQPDAAGRILPPPGIRLAGLRRRRSGAGRQFPLSPERLVRAGGVQVPARVAGGFALRPARRRQRQRLQQHGEPLPAVLLAKPHHADVRLGAQRIQPRTTAAGPGPRPLWPDRQPDHDPVHDESGFPRRPRLLKEIP
jgi:hypothetical protein